MNTASLFSQDQTRRHFLKQTGALAASAAVGGAAAPGVFGAGSDTLRIGLIGCGYRGTGAALDCVRSSPGVEIVALGNLFPDRLNGFPPCT